jgi:hypothetical protein
MMRILHSVGNILFLPADELGSCVARFALPRHRTFVHRTRGVIELDL